MSESNILIAGYCQSIFKHQIRDALLDIAAVVLI